MGRVKIPIRISTKIVYHALVVVEHMSSNILILGLDFLESQGCIVNYRELTITIGDSVLPLLKTSQNTTKPLLLICSETTKIPAMSTKSVRCDLYSNTLSHTVVTETHHYTL